MSRHAALHYLRVPRDAPWKWEEGGRVLAWKDGTTIAFREEIEVIVSRVSTTGLPPFPEVVLLLAACRGKLTELNQVPPEAFEGRGQLIQSLNRRREEQLENSLAPILQLPAELVEPPAGKALLVEAIAERLPRRSPEESEQIAAGLAEVWNEAELNTPRPDEEKFLFELTQLSLLDALVRHTVESLTLRLRTGLDALPEAAPEIGLPRGERARRLLEALAADEQLSGLARVVRDLMAALRLPRVLTQVDELAIGGAADIGNRGPLDRLLLSELAHDDLTLATRVALNEALYLRREPPAQRPERALAILLDCGLRMWGVPRVIGTAAALALVTGHASTGAVLTWRAEERRLAPVDLLDREGLEAHLAALATDLTPAQALPAVETELAQLPESDLVIVTHRDALGDRAFQAQLAQMKFDRGFLLLIERDGRVELHPLPWGAPRPLAQVQVDVNKLFAPPKQERPTAPLVTAGADDFPAIFRVQPFPLRLPVNGKMVYATTIDSGGMCVTADRRLLEWRSSDRGTRQLATDLPSGRTAWSHRDREDRIIVVNNARAGGDCVRVLVVAADAKSVQQVQIPWSDGQPAAWMDGGTLMLAQKNRVIAVSIAHAEVLADATVPADLRWLSGRYFSSNEGIQFASWHGSGVRWDSLMSGARLRRDEIKAVFDRDGIGAWVLTRDGRLLSPTGTVWLSTVYKVSDAVILDKGERIGVQRETDQGWAVIEVGAKNVRPVQRRPDHTPVVPPSRNLQSRFTAIWGAPGEPLRLRTPKGRWMEISARPDGELQLVESTVQQPESLAFPFENLRAPLSLGCSLRVAKWPGGSRAWIDSRGLLHLRSHDPAVSELSLALCCQTSLAGWCADGSRCGQPFYLDPGVEAQPALIRAALEQFCRHLC